LWISCSPSAILQLLTLLLFTHTAPPQLYTLSLHDALPISSSTPWTPARCASRRPSTRCRARTTRASTATARRSTSSSASGPRSSDRKSTRLNSSHVKISYAVFCLKKKKHKQQKGNKPDAIL